MTIYELSSGISSGAFDDQLRMLYGTNERNILRNRARYLSAAENFSRLYPECSDINVFSVGGRAEIGGNHTDHQHGKVISAALDADIIAIASPNDGTEVHINSEGFASFTVSVQKLTKEEKGTSASLVTGIIYEFKKRGLDVGGFDVYISSEVPVGCGMSSSAAFEVLIGNIINSLFNGGFTDIEIAEIGKISENVFFGKNCGLMDQVVCAVGGTLFIDFKDASKPLFKKIGYDLGKSGYSLCITDTGVSHAGIDSEYDMIAGEMKHIANEMGVGVLGEADEEDFFDNIPRLRKNCGDREILHAAHFFGETRRASEEAEALENGDTERFFELVNESGNSSAQLLQNLFLSDDIQHQETSLAIMISKRFLGGSGAVRIHGGGFGGSIIAFVPNYLSEDYSREMNRIFGENSCRIFNIRSVGSYKLQNN